MNKNKAIELKVELEKVSLFLDKAIQGKGVCSIERDLILEHLRKVYEEVLLQEAQIPVPEEDRFETIDKNSECFKKEKITGTAIEEKIPREDVMAEPVITMEELIEEPFNQVKIDRNLIESLYGDSSLCRKAEPEEESVRIENDNGSSEEVVSSGKVWNEALTDAAPKDIASMLSTQTASQLRNAIGLNDRLMLLNDLFNNDSELYEKTLTALDACDNIDDAYIYLYEHFTLDDNKEGVKCLISLLETKYN